MKGVVFCGTALAGLIFFGISGMCPRTASAEMLVYEGFDYPSGISLNGLGEDAFRWGTNRWSQQFATSDWMVFSNGLQFATLPVTGGGIRETNLTQGADYQRMFAPFQMIDGQFLWFSFLIRVTQAASWNVHLSSGPNESKFGVEGGFVNYLLRARIGVGDNGSTNTFNLGQNQVRLIVGRYRYRAGANEELDVWLDPDISFSPPIGGLSTTNHIVYSKQLTTNPDRRDRLLISNRSIGAQELDEFRVGTTWSDVVSRAIDTPVIESLVLNNTTLQLGISHLTVGATNHVESKTTLATQPTWEVLRAFVSTTLQTNLPMNGIATNSHLFIRIRSN